MDLKNELLQVLDNPSRVWEAIVNNMANAPRLTLLTFATCKTPVDIAEWQAAVAKISVDAAATFEGSLRVLDDLFVSVSRTNSRSYVASFRNPSMDDFCAGHLDANAGFALRVATMQPTIDQVERLVKLAGARHPEDPNAARFPHLHSSLIADPEPLLTRLLDLLPDASEPTDAFFRPADSIVQILTQTGARDTTIERTVRARVAPQIARMSFATWGLHAWLDAGGNARTLARLLGGRFEAFYESLCLSAEYLTDYDSLVNLDRALGRLPEEAQWADRFTSRAWLSQSDPDSIDSDREYFEKVAAHLALDVDDTLAEWTQAQEARAAAAAAEEDESWRNLPTDEVTNVGPTAGTVSPADKTYSEEVAQIDAMFASLVRAEPSD